MNIERKHLILAAVVILVIVSAIYMAPDPFSLAISHPVGSECTVTPGQHVRFTGSYTNTWDDSWSQRFRISQGSSVVYTSSTETVRGIYGTRSFDATVQAPSTPAIYNYEITAEFWTGSTWRIQWTVLAECGSNDDCVCDDTASCGSDVTCECRSAPTPDPNGSDDSLLYAAGGMVLLLSAYLIYRKRGE